MTADVVVDVVVLGSVNLDVVVGVPRLPAPGQTVLGSQVAFLPGGKGGNQAVAASRLGARTALCAAVGDDHFGTQLRTALKAEGVLLDQLSTIAGAATGMALIAVDQSGENTIVVVPGANSMLTGDRLASLRPREHSVLAMQLEIPLGTCLDAALQARRANATAMLNAAPLPPAFDPLLAQLLSTVDILVVNEIEAGQLGIATGIDLDQPTDPQGWADAAHRLRGLGPPTVVVTLGSQGAAAASAAGTFTRAAFAVEVVDTTGAGDSFCGALAVAVAAGRPLPEAVRQACAAGALATTKTGAQSALPTATELAEFLQSGRA